MLQPYEHTLSLNYFKVWMFFSYLIGAMNISSDPCLIFVMMVNWISSLKAVRCSAQDYTCWIGSCVVVVLLSVSQL